MSAAGSSNGRAGSNRGGLLQKEPDGPATKITAGKVMHPGGILAWSNDEEKKAKQPIPPVDASTWPAEVVKALASRVPKPISTETTPCAICGFNRFPCLCNDPGGETSSAKVPFYLRAPKVVQSAFTYLGTPAGMGNLVPVLRPHRTPQRIDTNRVIIPHQVYTNDGEIETIEQHARVIWRQGNVYKVRFEDEESMEIEHHDLLRLKTQLLTGICANRIQTEVTKEDFKLFGGRGRGPLIVTDLSPTSDAWKRGVRVGARCLRFGEFHAEKLDSLSPADIAMMFGPIRPIEKAIFENPGIYLPAAFGRGHGWQLCPSKDFRPSVVDQRHDETPSELTRHDFDAVMKAIDHLLAREAGCVLRLKRSGEEEKDVDVYQIPPYKDPVHGEEPLPISKQQLHVGFRHAPVEDGTTVFDEPRIVTGAKTSLQRHHDIIAKKNAKEEKEKEKEKEKEGASKEKIGRKTNWTFHTVDDPNLLMAWGVKSGKNTEQLKILYGHAVKLLDVRIQEMKEMRYEWGKIVYAKCHYLVKVGEALARQETDDFMAPDPLDDTERKLAIKARAHCAGELQTLLKGVPKDFVEKQIGILENTEPGIVGHWRDAWKPSVDHSRDTETEESARPHQLEGCWTFADFVQFILSDLGARWFIRMGEFGSIAQFDKLTEETRYHVLGAKGYVPMEKVRALFKHILDLIVECERAGDTMLMYVNKLRSACM